MKKIIPIAFLIIALAYITGCNNKNSVDSNKDHNTGRVAEAGIEHLTPETFKTKVFDYNSQEYKFVGDKPCIIDFYASWCGPCRIMAPRLEMAASRYKDKIAVYKVDVDTQRDLASAFGVTGIPTLLFCPKSGKPQMSSGVLSDTDLDKVITDILLK